MKQDYIADTDDWPLGVGHNETFSRQLDLSGSRHWTPAVFGRSRTVRRQKTLPSEDVESICVRLCGAMATCTVTYSPEVARRAARTYSWRKFGTLFGASYLASVPVMTGAIVFMYYMQGANWFVGAFGLLLFFNVLMQWGYYFTLPRALAKRLADPALRTAEITTSSDRVRIVIGPNASLLKWVRLKRIWLYDDFVILAINPPLQMRFTYIPTAGMSTEVRRDLEAASQGNAHLIQADGDDAIQIKS